ncbi:unnamed protein product [Rotaria magnacalcarata]|uniref:VCBS repeat-containing protein n=1 Tax=Rotaria magnacalcarata TaxID=392030 RepID=A0A8S2KPK1_9BILA|nr:unnamed protein product [Rotaria magnacalcarata]CAF4013805.1 unnamed protein product [Rotaria magnacalcarata]
MPSLQCHMCLISCLSAPYISIVITVGVIKVCVASSKDTRLQFGHDNGNFPSQRTFSLDSSRPLSLAIGDFNNDNRTDIVVVNDGTLTVIVLLGADDEYSRVPLNYQVGYDSIPYSVTVSDFNNDNQLNIVCHYYTTGDAYRLCSIAMGDFNNDERLDITRDVQCRFTEH